MTVPRVGPDCRSPVSIRVVHPAATTDLRLRLSPSRFLLCALDRCLRCKRRTRHLRCRRSTARAVGSGLRAGVDRCTALNVRRVRGEPRYAPPAAHRGHVAQAGTMCPLVNTQRTASDMPPTLFRQWSTVSQEDECPRLLALVQGRVVVRPHRQVHPAVLGVCFRRRDHPRAMKSCLFVFDI